ncbi:3'-5' exonuclease [Bifidobacterium catulorum]|uniref:Exonuclease domain-containing protein n=1 Tax=Bifidobacterium catulorum TaxID=1630173 RepID=A0A2U2MTM0_9BIFI|nr:3'-5' exonuclease [Bifidobacterium catulorum]PWG60209.1 hypothetical protein DF200_04010 [Bifidobacterium catulorum]
MRIASLDIETTGDNDIIEIGILFMDGDVEVDRFESLIDPGIPLSYFNNHISGITDDMLKGQPTIDKVLPAVLDRLRNWTILGHNIDYDLRCLNDAAMRMGLLPLFNDRIDTMEMSRYRFSDHRSHSLLDLLRVLNLADREEHRALSDAIQTWQCYKRLESSDEPLEWTDSLAERSRRTRAAKSGAFMKSRFLEDKDTETKNPKPNGETLPPGASVTVSGAQGNSEFLSSYGAFTYLWVEIDLGTFPSGVHAGEPTYHVRLDGRHIGYLTSKTMAKYIGRLPEHAVCRAHTKCNKKNGRTQLRLELPDPTWE